MKFDPMQLPSSSNVDQLHRRDREPLGEPARDLALDDHRVDAHAAVVDGDHLRTFHSPVSGSTSTDDRVRPERERHVGRVVVVVALQRRPPSRPGSRCTRRTRPPGSSSPGRARPSPRTFPASNSMSSSATSSRCAASFLAFSRTRRSTMAVAAPDTGVERGRTCRGRTVCCPCRRASPSCPRAGCRAPRPRSARTSSRGPAPGSDADLQDRLAGGMDPQLGAVVHLQPDDVVVLVRPGAHDLGERGEPDPVAACPGPGPPPAPCAGRVADLLERQVHRGLVVA